MRAALFLVLPFLGLLAVVARPSPDAATEAPQRHRSPVDVAILPDGRRALTANQTADTVSLIDLEAGKILAEVACGRRPMAIVCSPDGRRAAVSNTWSDSVSLFELSDIGLKQVAEVAVGRLPQGAVFAPDGGRLYVTAGEEIVRDRMGRAPRLPSVAGAGRSALARAVCRRSPPRGRQ